MDAPTGRNYNSAYRYSYQHPHQAKLNYQACPAQTPEFQVLKSEVGSGIGAIAKEVLSGVVSSKQTS